MVEGAGFGVTSGLLAQLQHFLGVWPWTSLFTFLSFGFFFCHLRLINGNGIEWVGRVNEPADVRHSAQCLHTLGSQRNLCPLLSPSSA